jgi:hypothetical protein
MATFAEEETEGLFHLNCATSGTCYTDLWGRPVATIDPLKGLDKESLALSAHPEFMDFDRTLAGRIRRRSEAFFG